MALTVSLGPKRLRYSHRQRIFLTSKENLERYMNIVRSWRRRMQLHLLKKLLKEPDKLEWYRVHGLKKEEYRKLLKPYMDRYSWRYHLILGIVHGLFLEMVIARLKTSGLEPDMGILHHRQRMGLALDICYILEPEQHLQTIQALRSRNLQSLFGKDGISPEGLRNIVQRFENKLPRLKVLTDAVIRNIIEAIEELEREGCIRLRYRGTGDEGKLSCLL